MNDTDSLKVKILTECAAPLEGCFFISFFIYLLDKTVFPGVPGTYPLRPAAGTVWREFP